MNVYFLNSTVVDGPIIWYENIILTFFFFFVKSKTVGRRTKSEERKTMRRRKMGERKHNGTIKGNGLKHRGGEGERVTREREGRQKGIKQGANWIKLTTVSDSTNGPIDSKVRKRKGKKVYFLFAYGERSVCIYWCSIICSAFFSFLNNWKHFHAYLMIVSRREKHEKHMKNS